MNDRMAVDYLVVDDDKEFRSRLVRALVRRSYSVVEAESVSQAEQMLDTHIPSRAVVDLRMPGASGLELVKSLRDRLPETEVVMLTGHGSISTAVEAMRYGARNYLTKPADADQVLAAFRDTPPETAAPMPPVASLDDIEWEHIQRVLRECDGNVTHAARLLGMHRRSLQRKLARDR